jgi:3',5'-cyclic AMP phosphodiesterase CpdA
MTFTHFLDTAKKNKTLAFLANEPTMVPLFVSDTVVPVDDDTLAVCQRFIHAIRQVADHPLYRQQTSAVVPKGTRLTTPDSALLCFDFYITEKGPRLIEVNTNGAGYPTIALLYAAHGIPSVPENKDLFDTLRSMFVAEWGPPVPGERVVIVDEDIFEQRTMFEFKSYQALFQEWGYTCDIVDVSDLRYEGDQLMALGKPVHKIYNRCCDFYLTTPSNAVLARAVQDPTVAVSPHPSSYALMADKGQMVRLSQEKNLRDYGCDVETIALIHHVIPPVRAIGDESPETWWQQRKNCFFKPQNTYGSKAVYKGDSISRKKFETLLDQAYVVQPYFNAGTTAVITDGVAQLFKYDLRFYVYGTDILLVGARLFQGQVTNFQTAGGGFAPVRIIHD